MDIAIAVFVTIALFSALAQIYRMAGENDLAFKDGYSRGLLKASAEVQKVLMRGTQNPEGVKEALRAILPLLEKQLEVMETEHDKLRYTSRE